MKFIALIFIIISFSASAQIKSAFAGVNYGAQINQEGSVPVSEMVVQLDKDKEFKGKIMGKVISVCQAEGCWMKIKQSTGNNILVRFKDHSFFVPANIMDKEVVLDGEAKMNITSVKMLQHYAEDEGKSKEEIQKITEPKKEIIFTASAVLVI